MRFRTVAALTAPFVTVASFVAVSSFGQQPPKPTVDDPAAPPSAAPPSAVAPLPAGRPARPGRTAPGTAAADVTTGPVPEICWSWGMAPIIARGNAVDHRTVPNPLAPDVATGVGASARSMG
jgi:hypothetical protein